jgi:hypothetical protein
MNTYIHLKTSRPYKIITKARNELDGKELVIYQSIEDGRVWARPASEFFDGRFKEQRGPKE